MPSVRIMGSQVTNGLEIQTNPPKKRVIHPFFGGSQLIRRVILHSGCCVFLFFVSLNWPWFQKESLNPVIRHPPRKLSAKKNPSQSHLSRPWGEIKRRKRAKAKESKESTDWETQMSRYGCGKFPFGVMNCFMIILIVVEAGDDYGEFHRS